MPTRDPRKVLDDCDVDPQCGRPAKVAFNILLRISRVDRALCSAIPINLGSAEIAIGLMTVAAL